MWVLGTSSPVPSLRGLAAGARLVDAAVRGCAAAAVAIECGDNLFDTAAAGRVQPAGLTPTPLPPKWPAYSTPHRADGAALKPAAPSAQSEASTEA